jgi:hypothetical protein
MLCIFLNRGKSVIRWLIYERLSPGVIDLGRG